MRLPLLLLALLPAGAAFGQSQDRIGINHAYWSDLSPGTTSTLYPKVASSGIGWLRITLKWADVEPSPPLLASTWRVHNLDWSKYDVAIDNAVAAGLKVHLSLVGPAPSWAVNPATPLRPTQDWQFGEFAEAAAHHYGAKVSSWGLYHEVNGPEQWAPAPDGTLDFQGYRDLILKPGFDGIRRAQPAALVSAPGVVIGDQPMSDCGAWTDPWVMENGQLVRPLAAITVHGYMPARNFRPVLSCLAQAAAARPGFPKYWLEEFGTPTWSTYASCQAKEQQEDSIVTAIGALENRSASIERMFYWQLQGVPDECGRIHSLFDNNTPSLQIGHKYCDLRAYARIKSGNPIQSGDACFGTTGCGDGQGGCDLDEPNRLVFKGQFIAGGAEEILIYKPSDQSYWLGQFRGDNLRFSYAGSTAGFGGAELSSRIWAADFNGAGRTDLLMWYPGDKNYWLIGIGDSGELRVRFAGNSAPFGGAEALSLAQVGDFRGLGRKQVLFWYPPDRNYFIATITADAVSLSMAGNTSGLGGAESVSRMFVGDFRGQAKDQLMFYYPPSRNYYIGTMNSLGQMVFTFAANTNVYAGSEANDPMWTGKFRGLAAADLLFYRRSESTYFVGRVSSGGALSFTRLGSSFPAPYDLSWAGRFLSSSQDSLAIYNGQTKTYSLLSIGANGQGVLSSAGDTRVFGGAELASSFWVGKWMGTARDSLLFFFPPVGDWWRGDLSSGPVGYVLSANTSDGVGP
ncbi:MAG: hypothetical protein U1E65_04095 [Myxococcota bacterium]